MFWLFVENIALPVLEFSIPIGIFLYNLNKRKVKNLSLTPLIVLFLISMIFCFAIAGIRFTSTGFYGVETEFGAVTLESTPHDSGITWIRPWRQLYQMNSRPQLVHAAASVGEKDLQVVAKDGLLLTVDANFTLLVNKKYAGHVYSAYGSIEHVVSQLMVPASHTAIKTSGLAFDGKEAWETNREGFQTAIHDNFEKTVRGQISLLPEFRGLSDDDLKQVFTFPPTMLGPTLPPTVVTDQVALHRAADLAELTEESLKKVAIAKQETATEEAKAVTAYYDSLPKGVTLSDVTGFIYARSVAQLLSDKSRQIGPFSIMVSPNTQSTSAPPTVTLPQVNE